MSATTCPEDGRHFFPPVGFDSALCFCGATRWIDYNSPPPAPAPGATVEARLIRSAEQAAAIAAGEMSPAREYALPAPGADEDARCGRCDAPLGAHDICNGRHLDLSGCLATLRQRLAAEQAARETAERNWHDAEESGRRVAQRLSAAEARARTLAADLRERETALAATRQRAEAASEHAHALAAALGGALEHLRHDRPYEAKKALRAALATPEGTPGGTKTCAHCGEPQAPLCSCFSPPGGTGA